MARKFYSASGVPIFNEEEKAFLHADMISRPCKPCGAKAGKLCILNAEAKTKMKPGTVHMGRLPDGYDTLTVVEGRNTEEKKKRDSHG